MDYCIVKDGKIENIIVIEDEKTIEAFGAVPVYAGARIGDTYAPPPEPAPTPTEPQFLGQQITDEQLERIELGQAYTDLELAILTGGTAYV